ncbi:MAG: cellulase family glycosylhydrolase [Patescibacteria group bacterium]
MKKKEHYKRTKLSQRKFKIMLWLLIPILIGFLFFYFFKLATNFPWRQNLEYRTGYFGVTFSTKFSSELGLDWREVYLAIIDDLGVKEIRLPIYWDQIETASGVYDFSDYDYIISEGAKRNVKFIANIGWRLPRWPECHAPEWAEKKSLAATQANALRMLDKVVNHYKDEPSIVAWQLENEPFFNAFGVCPPSDENFFKAELATVKKLDNRPVMVSATGELSWWEKEAKYGDWFGSTLYRVVWGPYTGYFRYPIPAWFYNLKAYLAGIKPQNRYIIELQAEPWVPEGNMIYLSPEEAAKSFNLEQFRANLQFAINVNFNKAYLWGVEWWYYQYKNGDKAYWELARTLFK